MACCGSRLRAEPQPVLSQNLVPITNMAFNKSAVFMKSLKFLNLTCEKWAKTTFGLIVLLNNPQTFSEPGLVCWVSIVTQFMEFYL